MRHGRRKNGRSAQAAALGLQPHGRRGGGGEARDPRAALRAAT